jgi:hypothetical protein
MLFVEVSVLNKQSVEESAETPAKPKTFVWEAAMIEVLRSAPGGEMPVERLRELVLAEYYESRSPEGKRKTRERACSWFDRMLKKGNVFEVRNMVKLVAAESDVGDDLLVTHGVWTVITSRR